MELIAIIAVSFVVIMIVFRSFFSGIKEYSDVKIETATRIARLESAEQLTKKAEKSSEKFKNGIMSPEDFDDFLESSYQRRQKKAA